MAKISIFGLGYVGAVSVAAFADMGHQVSGVDVNPTKVSIINSGRSPVIEKGLSELIGDGVADGRVCATTDAREAVLGTEISIICVGTPSRPNGDLDLTYIRRVSEQIGQALAQKDTYHTVIARSTMLPGSTEEVVIPILEESSGKVAGRDFGVCFNPEFLREGSSIDDFYEPPYTVIGGHDARATAVVQSLYEPVDPNPVVVPIKVAEMVKYTSNAFHALKVVFANEIGNICKQQEIDSHAVMDIFCRDTKLNISPAYLKPGFAFGGSCLPKDLRALRYQSRRFDQYTPVLDAILPSNGNQIDLAFEMVQRAPSKSVGVLGFSFKAGTDDLRESPIVELVERLLGKGYTLKVYDRNVSLANLQGANRAYIEQEIPHIASLMTTTPEEVLHHCDVLVIGNGAAEFREVLRHARPEQTIIDLVRITKDVTQLNGEYQGICW